MKQIYYEDMNVGDILPSLVKNPVNEVQLVRYAGASGDFNPLHTVDAIGKKAGFDGVIAHGMLIMGFMAQAITSWIPNSCLKKFNTRFLAVTKPGEIITVSGLVADKKIEESGKVIVCDIQASNQKGEIKIKGSFEAVLPERS